MKYLTLVLLGLMGSTAWADVQIINQCNSAGIVSVVSQSLKPGANCDRQTVSVASGGTATIVTDNQNCKNYQAYFMSTGDSMSTDGALGAQSCVVPTDNNKPLIFQPGSGGKAASCTCSG